MISEDIDFTIVDDVISLENLTELADESSIIDLCPDCFGRMEICDYSDIRGR